MEGATMAKKKMKGTKKRTATKKRAKKTSGKAGSKKRGRVKAKRRVTSPRLPTADKRGVQYEEET
jgi:hypothetical protein